jgi:hypothetical protein
MSHLQHLQHLADGTAGHVLGGAGSPALDTSLGGLIRSLSPTIWFRGDESSGVLVDEITAMPATAAGSISYARRGGAKGVNASIQGNTANSGFATSNPTPVENLRAGTSYTILEFFRGSTTWATGHNPTLFQVGAAGSRKVLFYTDNIGSGTARALALIYAGGEASFAVGTMSSSLWYLMAFRYSGTSNVAELWTSAGKVASASNNSVQTTPGGTGGIYLGKGSFNDPSYTPWSFHDFAVFDRVLTDAQIASFQQHIRTAVDAQAGTVRALADPSYCQYEGPLPVTVLPAASPLVDGENPDFASTIVAGKLQSGSYSGLGDVTGLTWATTRQNFASAFGDAYYVPDGSSLNINII